MAARAVGSFVYGGMIRAARSRRKRLSAVGDWTSVGMRVHSPGSREASIEACTLSGEARGLKSRVTRSLPRGIRRFRSRSGHGQPRSGVAARSLRPQSPPRFFDGLEELLERLHDEQHVLEVIDLEFLLEHRVEFEGSPVATRTQRVRAVSVRRDESAT